MNFNILFYVQEPKCFHILTVYKCLQRNVKSGVVADKGELIGGYQSAASVVCLSALYY